MLNQGEESHTLREGDQQRRHIKLVIGMGVRRLALRQMLGKERHPGQRTNR